MISTVENDKWCLNGICSTKIGNLQRRTITAACVMQEQSH